MRHTQTTYKLPFLFPPQEHRNDTVHSFGGRVNKTEQATTGLSNCLASTDTRVRAASALFCSET